MLNPTMLRRFLLLILILGLVGCSGPTPVEETPLLEATPTPTVVPIATEETGNPEPEGPTTLRIWVPPQFDPANGSPEGEIFQTQLDGFAMRKPNVIIDVRVKNVEGYGGILDTLTTASAAAPLALPDLVALPRHALETATENGLLHPYDGLTTILDDPDWYDFARQMSHFKNATFGIPFAGDAMVMAYRPDIIPEPPVDWETSLSITSTLSFPAADPAAIFTLSQYQSLGIPLEDENEQPTLDVIQLTNVLSYYQQASASELMPFWLTQFENDEQSWASFLDTQADLAITWTSRYLQAAPADTAAIPILTSDGVPFTLTDGWVWALTAHDPDRQLAAAQLAEFLTTSEYLASWTEAAGLLPPRPSATEAWSDESLKTFANQIASTAQLLPSLEIVTMLGPILQQATISVLKAESDATVAAETAVEKLNNQP